ncbi:hypothetical protein EDC04DRAFT_2603227 [Pisolithus marmoratus]|nr:hypothetical protein EDC04DRAFT_2603227 [Pisolithus marmoratus]
MHEQIHCQQLAEEGSKHDIDEEDEVDCQSDSDDRDMQFTHQVVRTKLSEATNEQLKYCDGKVPKALNTKVPSIDLETHGETVTTDDELSKELCWSWQTSPNCQLSKHKRSKDKDYAVSNCQSGKHKKSKQIHTDHRTPELEDTAYVTYLQRQWQPADEDLVPAMVKVQKLTENDSHPDVRDYGNVTQEFMATAPMPDHAQETALLNASWARGCQVMGMNLVQSPQLVKLVCGQLKTKLQPLVKAMYGFYSSQTEELKEVYGHSGGWMVLSPTQHLLWFSPAYVDSSSGVIECCIDEWVTGMQMDIAFTIQENHGVFKSHLNCLHEFEEATKEFEVLPGICKKMYEVGWWNPPYQAIPTYCSKNTKRAQPQMTSLNH